MRFDLLKNRPIKFPEISFEVVIRDLKFESFIIKCLTRF